MKKKHIQRTLIYLVGSILISCAIMLISDLINKQIAVKKVDRQISLGNDYFTNSDYLNAISAYQNAINIDIECEEAYIALVDAYIKTQQYEDAKALLMSYSIIMKTTSEQFQTKVREVDDLILKENETAESTIQSELESVDVSEQANNDLDMNEPLFIPWSEAGLEDHIMDWQDERLKVEMEILLNIHNRDIMLSDVWGLTKIEFQNIFAYCYEQKDGMINNIDALGELKNLREIDLFCNNISDISVLSNLTNLEKLVLSSNKVSDINSLSNLQNLKYLELSDNSISDIDAFYNLNITELNISSNQIQDISTLSKMTNLTLLNISNNNISDITSLSELVNLYALNIGSNSLNDINALSNLTKLQWLYLNDTNVSDISCISNMKDLTLIDITDTLVTDRSALNDIEGLIEWGIK